MSHNNPQPAAMTLRLAADRERVKRMTAAELREQFVIADLFRPGEVSLSYVEVDRAVAGSAVPLDSPLALPTHKELASEYFAQRREIGLINIGGGGTISIDGQHHALDKLDSFYIGRGARDIRFESTNASVPAKFYFVSYPAHTAYPSKRIVKSEAKRVDLGDATTANRRTIFQSIHSDIVPTCQVVMGFTQLQSGSVWNTMPPHTHRRRSEIYMYFDIEANGRVFHFMGEPNELRSLVLDNGEAAFSPIWSVHCGAGTAAYTFVWSMGGENQEFDDMDRLTIDELR